MGDEGKQASELTRGRDGRKGEALLLISEQGGLIQWGGHDLLFFFFFNLHSVCIWKTWSLTADVEHCSLVLPDDQTNLVHTKGFRGMNDATFIVMTHHLADDGQQRSLDPHLEAAGCHNDHWCFPENL